VIMIQASVHSLQCRGIGECHVCVHRLTLIRVSHRRYDGEGERVPFRSFSPPCPPLTGAMAGPRYYFNCGIPIHLSVCVHLWCVYVCVHHIPKGEAYAHVRRVRDMGPQFRGHRPQNRGLHAKTPAPREEGDHGRPLPVRPEDALQDPHRPRENMRLSAESSSRRRTARTRSSSTS